MEGINLILICICLSCAYEIQIAQGLTRGQNNVCSRTDSRQTCTSSWWSTRCRTVYYETLYCCSGWTTETASSPGCDVYIASCSSNPCYNGATCVNGRDLYTCTCLDGWEGTNCQYYVQSCNSSPCQHGGTCVNGRNTYTCRCTGAYSGYNCQTYMRSCDSGPCYNGGTCFNEPDAYSCFCDLRWTGSRCQQAGSPHCEEPSIDNGVAMASSYYFDDIVTYTCNEGYNLTDGNAARTCTRSDGLSGYWSGAQPRCAFVRSCLSNPCENGATCVDGLDSYVCVCAYGWSGTHCEFDILPPVIEHCPDNLTEFTSSSQLTITWDVPVFFDYHGENEPYIIAQNYDEPEATLPWGEYIMQYAAVKQNNGMTTECLFSTSVYPIPCSPLSPPTNGAIACNGWNSRFGAICTLFCESERDVEVGVRIEEVYVCGASGNWIPALAEGVECSENRSNLTASGQSHERQQHYYAGSCYDTSAQNVISQAYIDVIMSHVMSNMCTSERFVDQCTANNVDIVCG